ncbi:MAG: TetR/AcrR family transcriptional regulator [Hyphomicrobiales bacterium]|nr:TetR/AcrR family transcriptional regulator [Hyphomicrobiales bacterium]
MKKANQRKALVDAAERAIAEGGTASLRARELAREIGAALGAIYNLVADLDELYLRVATRTLARLDEALAASTDGGRVADPVERLVAIALAYRRFASENLHLWRALFEHRMAPGKPLPDWALTDQMQLFRHIVEPLTTLSPRETEAQRMAAAHTLFSAVHGVVLLGLEEKFVGVPPDLLDAQISWLVRTTCRGLRSESDRSA